MRSRMRSVLSLFVDMHGFDRMLRTAEEINLDLFSQLEVVRGHDAPFFLFVNYMDAHEPYVPPSPYHSMFRPYGPEFDHRHHRTSSREVMAFQRSWTDAEREFYLSRYDGAIRYLDDQIKELVAHLKAIGQPVCGDPEYGTPGRLGLDRQFLHATRLAFAHPHDGAPIEVVSELPGDLAAALAAAAAE